MTLHKTDHLSEKDIQKRKSTFSNFELQAAFFLALISKSKRLMMSEDFFFIVLTYYKKSQNIQTTVGGLLKLIYLQSKVWRVLARKFKASFQDKMTSSMSNFGIHCYYFWLFFWKGKKCSNTILSLFAHSSW